MNLLYYGKNNITVKTFPAHTTNLLQPLDLGFFSPFKCRWRKEIAKFVNTNDKLIMLENLGRILVEAWQPSTTPEQIKICWKKYHFRIPTDLKEKEKRNNLAMIPSALQCSQLITTKEPVFLDQNEPKLGYLKLTKKGTVLTSREGKEVLSRIAFEKQKRAAKKEARKNEQESQSQSSIPTIMNVFHQCDIQINQLSIHNDEPKKQTRKRKNNSTEGLKQKRSHTQEEDTTTS